MAAMSQLLRKTLHGKSISLNMLITVPVSKTCCRSYKSEFFRKYALENVAEKKRLLNLEDTPEAREVIDIEESASEWKYVERLLPKLTVPVFSNSANHVTYSGWKPPAETAPNLPYYVRRQRNQLLPIYFESRNGQQRLFTIVKYIEGDIWAFEKDLRSYLEKSTNSCVMTQVHEVVNQVRFRGDHVNKVKSWLFERGF